MKKVLLSLLAVAGCLLASSEAVKAQTPQQPLKIGVFDIEIMMQVMPGYRGVDSAVQVYERDSLANEYDFYQSEYHRLDSTYKADSAAGKAKSVLDLQKQSRQQVAMNLIYWQQIAENKSQQKRAILAQPITEKVVAAYKKVLDAKKFTLVLKPNSFEFFGSSAVENIFVLVAKELKVALPQELGGTGNVESDEAKPAGAGTKPAPKAH
ncbi:Outer membrane protein (OmpH-like) [Filimonas lacunae]|uniref:Outer membrane protein (OmpH-like) n=1 Tax=Filimonas lacunae TaxID=477680 RepID=A0A173MQX1_9BACT|nr:OmpH family outer membrane protein [Filimonas lacunae]BAV09887.1 hypothetical protein FLA_5940 [Filimonas lacunae]SIS80522.1 Outer membrane protein (OmpH-like) [Filimonas lacunae]